MRETASVGPHDLCLCVSVRLCVRLAPSLKSFYIQLMSTSISLSFSVCLSFHLKRLSHFLSHVYTVYLSPFLHPSIILSFSLMMYTYRYGFSMLLCFSCLSCRCCFAASAPVVDLDHTTTSY